jgi:fatty-acid desaturase
VNSATHIWGSRRFATRDDSTNNWFVAFLTFGEGWHNNHHAHPTSARHGVEWYDIDMNWYGIWVLKAFGLATQIRRVRASNLVREEAPAENSLLPSRVQNLQSIEGD